MEDQALKVTGGERSRAKEEDRFGERGRGRGNFRGRGRSRGRASFNKSMVECYRCHKLGHFQYECPSYAHYAKYAEPDEDQEMLLMSYVETHNSKREKVWFLDSGCRYHMSEDKQWFMELDQSFRHSIKLGSCHGKRKCQNTC